MKFIPLEISGAYKLIPEMKVDSRGAFGRVLCAKELHERGLESSFVQENISHNLKRGTFRGMHFQKPPKEEAKIVSCHYGSAIDIVLDLRENSSTYRKWETIEISQANRISVYIPKGCAHGFITLVDNTELYYHMSEFYHPEFAGGVRWSDPAFAIQLPEKISVISDTDMKFPDYV